MKPTLPSAFLKRLVLGSGTLCLAATGTACFERQATIDPSILQLQERIILLELKIKEAEHNIAELQHDAPDSAAAEDQTERTVTHPREQPSTASSVSASSVSANSVSANSVTPAEPHAEATDQVTQSADKPTAAQLETMDPHEHESEGSMATAEAIGPAPEANQDKPAPLVEMGVYDVASKYQEAYSHYNNRRYSEAKAIYQNIAENYSNHKLAPNAYYWWGEVEYDRGNYNQAVLAFQRLLDRFPKSHKVPDALLKLGKSREKLGQISEAREDYQRVIDRYPDSRAAAVAKTWL